MVKPSRVEPDSLHREPLVGPEFDAVLAAAQDGADFAWKRLIQAYSGPLLGYLRLRGAPEPEDALSETWIGAAVSIHGFTGDEAAFRSWLFVIAHRRAIDARRRQGRQPPRNELPEGEELESTATVASAEEHALESMASQEAVQMLDCLTPDQRIVVTLRVVAGLSLEETAQVVGKRAGAVKALQHRALETLRRRIDEAYPDERSRRLRE